MLFSARDGASHIEDDRGMDETLSIGWRLGRRSIQLFSILLMVLEMDATSMTMSDGEDVVAIVRVRVQVVADEHVEKVVSGIVI